MDNEQQPTVGIIAAFFLFLGVAVKAAFKRKDAQVVRTDRAQAELQEEVRYLRERVGTLTKELDTWRERYFSEQREYNELLVRHKLLADQHDRLSKRNEILMLDCAALDIRLSELRKILLKQRDDPDKHP